MQSKYKLILGSLVGALAIHFSFAACGHDESGGIFDGGLLDGLFVSPDAKAGTDGGADAAADGGSCACPVVKSVSADMDTNQLLTGSSYANTANQVVPVVKIVEGPLVLTDATPGQGTAQAWASGWGYSTQLTLEPSASACAGTGTVFEQIGATTQNGSMGNTIHGGRYLVPAGKMLCAQGNLIWAGFRPYE